MGPEEGPQGWVGSPAELSHCVPGTGLRSCALTLPPRPQLRKDTLCEMPDEKPCVNVKQFFITGVPLTGGNDFRGK